MLLNTELLFMYIIHIFFVYIFKIINFFNSFDFEQDRRGKGKKNNILPALLTEELTWDWSFLVSGLRAIQFLVCGCESMVRLV